MTMLKFPSPCGDYGSYHIRLKKEYGEKLIGFPSPCGDYGSYRGIYMCVIAVYEFPSPCGDYGSYRRPFPSHRKRRQIYISVPLRGLWFLSRPCQVTMPSIGFTISVPLRGLWFLSLAGFSDIIKRLV